MIAFRPPGIPWQITKITITAYRNIHSSETSKSSYFLAHHLFCTLILISNVATLKEQIVSAHERKYRRSSDSWTQRQGLPGREEAMLYFPCVMAFDMYCLQFKLLTQSESLFLFNRGHELLTLHKDIETAVPVCKDWVALSWWIQTAGYSGSCLSSIGTAVFSLRHRAVFREHFRKWFWHFPE